MQLNLFEMYCIIEWKMEILFTQEIGKIIKETTHVNMCFKSFLDLVWKASV